MTKDDAITRACRIVNDAWKRVDPEALTASDCFCRIEADSGPHRHDYVNDEKGFRFISYLIANATDEDVAQFNREDVGRG